MSRDIVTVVETVKVEMQVGWRVGKLQQGQGLIFGAATGDTIQAENLPYPLFQAFLKAAALPPSGSTAWDTGTPLWSWRRGTPKGGPGTARPQKAFSSRSPRTPRHPQ